MSICGAPVMALFGACLLVAGCGAAPVEPGEEEVGSAEEAIGVLNGNDPNFFWLRSTQLYLDNLAMGALVDTGNVAATPLLNSAEGRHLLHYVFGCALPRGVTVAAPGYGITYEGLAGLAPDWADKKLLDAIDPRQNLDAQRWVTACLLQTLNGVGTHVPLHMIGSHKGLADDPKEDFSAYTIPDATMFGNIFGRGEPYAYACVSKDVQSLCGASWSVYAWQRICDSSPTCGLTLLPGSCASYCETDGAGNPTCRVGFDTYAESIATMLEQTGYRDQYPRCAAP